MQRIERTMQKIEDKLLLFNALRKTIVLKSDKQFRDNRLLQQKNIAQSLVIIANGPSINDAWDAIAAKDDCDYMCVNYFAFDIRRFKSIKPKYYCMIDHHGFDNENITVQEFTGVLNREVDWDMVFIHYAGQKLPIENPFITEKLINYNYYDTPKKGIIKRCYDNNLMTVYARGVVVAAIYSGILMGYKQIYIYGMEYSRIKDFHVDINNHVLIRDKHFYGQTVTDLTENSEEYRKNGILWAFQTNLWGFKALRDMRKYAELNGVKIYNCYPKSFVDAFDKII